jgi:hypothetical protein
VKANQSREARNNKEEIMLSYTIVKGDRNYSPNGFANMTMIQLNTVPHFLQRVTVF